MSFLLIKNRRGRRNLPHSHSPLCFWMVLFSKSSLNLSIPLASPNNRRFGRSLPPLSASHAKLYLPRRLRGDGASSVQFQFQLFAQKREKKTRNRNGFQLWEKLFTKYD